MSKRVGTSGKYFEGIDYIIENEEPFKEFVEESAFFDSIGMKDHIYGLRLEIVATGEGKEAMYFAQVHVLWNKLIHKETNSYFNLSTGRRLLDLYDDIDKFMDSVKAKVDINGLISRIVKAEANALHFTEEANAYTNILKETLEYEKFQNQTGGVE